MIIGRSALIWILPLLVLFLGITPDSVLAQQAPPPPAAPPAAATPPAAPAAAAASYEVWVIDQSDSSKDGGGTLYIYDGESLSKDAKSAKAETLDLGDKFAEACKEAGGYPKRPHMLFFTKDGKYGILSYVASGHVVFLDAAARAPIGCVSLGKNAHAAYPAPNMKVAIGANIAEKKLVRIWTDYANKKFTINPPNDVVALAPLEAAGLPDMSPICPIVENKSQFVFVTPRGGGLVVFDLATSPLTPSGSLTRDAVKPAGCGGVQIGTHMYLNSGGGWPATPLNHDVYNFTTMSLPEVSVPIRIGGRDGGDSHGMVAVNNRYIWAGDRHLNTIDVYDSKNDDLKVGSIFLAGDVSKDPAPDLMDSAPDSSYVFAALRGPSPLTGNNKDVGNAVGSTPGVGVIKVEDGGRRGTFVGIAPISKMVEEKDKDGNPVKAEKADPHGIQVRKK